MVRIYLGLAGFAAGMLVATLALGLRIGDLQGASQQLLARRSELRKTEQSLDRNPQAVQAAKQAVSQSVQDWRPLRNRTTLHMLTGIAAALVTILVNSITVTYFIGTSRWCREVVDTYDLPEELAERSTRLKRKAFPWALLGIVTVLGVAALGAASDPGAGLEVGPNMPTLHYLAAVAGVCLVVYSFWRQSQAISGNYQVIEEVMRDVHQRREEQGLA